jgi:WD40 repeat protein/serine/threonine protein kinase/DNA-binding XRE family transcriptional regulator
MNEDVTFGQVVKERRSDIGLTQTELARRVGCAAITIRKIEADDLRPSVQMAELIALALNVPEAEQLAFVRLARAARAPSPIPTPSPLPGEIGLTDLSGRAVKGFQLGEKIGSGGYGVVYRAVQPSIARDVAVKIILPRYANNPNFIRRFEAEAQLIARLEHPHIVPLYDYWREPNAAYLIMRLLRGGSLADQLKDGPIPVELVGKYAQQIGLALDVAHRHGVIHRDIKPANVLLDEEANAYLADFGIAKNLERINGESLTEVGAMIGSLAYISPEQILAEPVQPQSDIYCLGIMLYEMLTGHKPFSGPTPVAFIQQHLSEALPSLQEHNPDLPTELDAVIFQATVRNADDRFPDVPSLLRALQQALPSAVTPTGEFVPVTPLELTTQELAELENPYKGLRAFAEADAGHFYGRATLIQELFSHLSDQSDLTRFLAIVGPSGSGKSSVARAGLIPALRRGGLPGSEDWFVLDFTPGAHPWEEVEAALLRVAVNPPESLLGQLQEGDRGLLRAVQRILPDDGTTELVLIIDQFEEIFTLVEDDTVREQFMNSLVTAVLDERSRLRIIITLRADFYDRPLQYVDFGDLLRQRTVSVLPMTPDELEAAINKPAAHVGLRLEPGLAAAIIRDVGDQPGALPLMQYALTELFENRDKNVMTLAAYREAGGVTGALARRADEIYEGLDENDRAATRQLFLRLITLGEGVEDTRRRVRLSELESLTDYQLSVTEQRLPIAEYGRYRLLTFDRNPITREPTVEVAHEALLREWGRLRSWLVESRDDIRNQRQVARAAAEWVESGREGSFLIPGGAKLEQFKTWRDSTGVALTRVEEEYLQASVIADTEQKEREARQARTRRNLQRGLISALTVGLIVAIGLSIFAFGQQRLANEQKQEARRQASIGLAALAEGELEGVDRELGVLLALEAVEQYPFTPQAAGALAQSVEEFRAFRELDSSTSVADLIMVATWSPDGKRIAGSSSPSPNSVVIWDAATGDELLSVNTHEGLCQESFTLMHDLAWSPSGDRLAVTAQNADSGEGCGIVVFDTVSGERLLILAQEGSAGRSIDWSPDGAILLTGHEDGIARLWDTHSGDELVTLTSHSGMMLDAVFSSDGRHIATASEDGTVRLWDAATGEAQKTLSGHAGAVRSVEWSPDGTRLVTGGNDGLPRVWDVESGETLFVLPGHIDGVVIVTWSGNGRRLASQSLDAIVKVWDAATGGFLFQIPNAAPDPATKRGFVEFSPDDNWILAGGSRVLGLRIWDASTTVPKLFGHTFGQEWGGWSPDGTLIATSGEDGSARLWDAATGQQLKEFDQGSFWGDWSPDGSRLAFADGIGAHAITVWDVKTGELLATLSAPDDEYGSPQLLTMDWSPDGAFLAADDFRPGLTQAIYVWDAETTELVSTWQTDDTCHLGWPRWSPDGSRIATGCIFVEAGINTPARIWDVASGREIMTLESEYGWTFRAVWSPDGTRILTTYENGAAIIWDVETGESLLTFTRHQGAVDGKWSPDGTLIASTDYAEQLAKIWDSETGEELMSFSIPGAPLTIGWSPDGTQVIVTGDGFNEAVIKRVWTSTEELVDYAYDCCVSRELTPEERAQFGLPERP